MSILKKNKMKSLHLWAFEKHLIFQNAHMGWMDGCWIMLDNCSSKFTGQAIQALNSSLEDSQVQLLLLDDGCMGKNESNSGVSRGEAY